MTWHVGADGRRFRVYERTCIHGGCFAARCECGHLLTAHDFDTAAAERSARDALAKAARPPFFGHPTCSASRGTLTHSGRPTARDGRDT